jgi:thiamine-monophosphate kinase
VLDVTVCGTVKRRQALLRKGAQPGDELWVSGTIGGAAAGLQYLKSTVAESAGTRDGPPLAAVSSLVEHCVKRCLYPEPRVRLGLLLARNRAATACMDLSDGLGEAVHQLAAASAVGAVIDASKLPIEPGARAWFESHGLETIDAAVSGGDDYELLFAVRPRSRGRLTAALRHGGVPLTLVGTCTESAEIQLHTGDGCRPLARGFSHFR